MHPPPKPNGDTKICTHHKMHYIAYSLCCAPAMVFISGYILMLLVGTEGKHLVASGMALICMALVCIDFIALYFLQTLCAAKVKYIYYLNASQFLVVLFLAALTT